MTKPVRSLDYFVLGGVLRVQAGDMKIQTQPGTRNLIHFGRLATTPSSDSSTFSDCPAACPFDHHPFLAEEAAFWRSVLRLVQQDGRNQLSCLCILLLSQENSEFLTFHFSKKGLTLSFLTEV